MANGEVVIDLGKVNLTRCLTAPAARQKLDSVVNRGEQSLVWRLPTAAISMKIVFLPPYDCVNKAIQYSRGTDQATLPKTAHAWQALSTPRGMDRLQIHYTIEVTYPFGTITIDPMVEILP